MLCGCLLPPINCTSYKDAVGRGFNSLFAYIQGSNDQAAKIDMTKPILVDVYPSTGPFCNSSFVMHFYVPQKYQKSPPLSVHARPVRLPRHKYAAVRRFGGFVDDTNIATQALALKRSLKDNPWGSQSAVPFSVAGYSPYEYENRVNEVILWCDKF
ncbi:uncharacterized protein LOC132276162 [Cornus florida]|uniref:uncharacterized protein LOC132276162 n=1 Tax=Cornus florida TaxID=4283 RepID=UPI0028A0A459|nr:uncharacterized protein LOC132276162 [Cornus florida]